MSTKCIIAVLMLTASLLPAAAFSLPKTLDIQGTVIYSQQHIIRSAGIAAIPKGSFTFRTIADAIIKFYTMNGYTLARVELVDETFTSITVFVDEGRLNRIVFKNLNTLDTLRIQYQFSIPHRIYHKPTVKNELAKIKKKYGIKDINAVITQSRDFSDALFQIDRLGRPFREGKLPFMPALPLPLPPPRYDLTITVVPHSADERGGLQYGLDTSFSHGLIPYVRYTHINLVQQDDVFRIGAKTGFMWGLDGRFKQLPYNTFNEMKAVYNFRPYFDKLFIPRISSQVFNSKAGRSDLGLDEYNYIRMNVLLEPGIKPIERLKIFPGYGVEKVYILESRLNPASTQPAVKKEHHVWQFAGLEADIDFIPFSLKHTSRRKIVLNVRRYQSFTHFYAVTIDTIFRFEFPNYDLFVFDADYTYLNGPVPFYYEEPVSSGTFKGFMGSSYHTTHIARCSFEYNISAYRDFVYIGAYYDTVLFEGKYLLKGAQAGLAAGLCFRYIFFEQFEFALWWGKDYLASSNESGNNLKFSFSKKW